jgi:hypothetical protein
VRPALKPVMSSIIVGARTEAQLEDNLRALSVKLTSENLKELDEASRPDWDYPWDVLRDAEAGDAQPTPPHHQPGSAARLRNQSRTGTEG